MIEEFNYLVRVMALGSSLMLLALVVANEIRRPIKLPLAGLVVGVIGYLINSTPLTTPHGPFDPWVDLVSISTPFFIWLFSRHLFERPPEKRPMLAAVAALLRPRRIHRYVCGTAPCDDHGYPSDKAPSV